MSKTAPLIADAFPEIPEQVQTLVEQYVKKLRQRMTHQKAEDALRDEVIESMREHKIDRVPLPDEDDKFLVLVHGEDRVKIKKREDANGED